LKKKLAIGAIVAALAVPLALQLAPASAEGEREFAARLSGYKEVPSISTRAHGRFRATLRDGKIHYRLRYNDFTSDVQQAHLHFAQKHVNGAVVAFLCGGGDKPACPARGGVVTGVINRGDVVEVPAQGIGARELGEVKRAMRHRAIYVNVHSETFPSGEIRGQVHRVHR
jgi:CHRD domain